MLDPSIVTLQGNQTETVTKQVHVFYSVNVQLLDLILNYNLHFINILLVFDADSSTKSSLKKEK